MRVRAWSRGVRFVGAVLVLALGLPAGSAAGPDPSKVFVRSLTYGGSGCPRGTASLSLSADRTMFTVLFDRYVSSVGPGVPITNSRVRCQINVGLRVPAGWSYSIGTVDYRGFVQLPLGQTARQWSVYYFPGSTQQASAQSLFVGPVARDYLLRDTLAVNATVWSPCGAPLPVNINTALAIENSGNRGAPGQITSDSIDGKVTHVYGLTWRGC